MKGSSGGYAQVMRVFRDRKVRRAALLVVFLALAVVVALTVPLPDVDEVRAVAMDIGPWAIVGFAALYAVLTLVPLPTSVLTIAAGLLWGFPLGFAAVYVGAVTGALGGFAISRWLGREAIERLTGARVAKVDKALGDHGLSAVIVARLVPVIPFTLLNYTVGLTSVKFRHYFLGTAIGIIPGSAAYTAVGAYGFELDWPFFVAVAVLGVMTVGGGVYAARFRRRTQTPEPVGAPE